MDAEKLTLAYRKLNEFKKSLEAKHAEKMARVNSDLAMLKLRMKEHLEATGSESVKTLAGTFFKQKSDSVSVGNQGEWMQFVHTQVKEAGIEALWLLECRASKSSVKNWMEAHENAIPPGIKYDQFYSIGVKAPTKKRSPATEEEGEK